MNYKGIATAVLVVICMMLGTALYIHSTARCDGIAIWIKRDLPVYPSNIARAPGEVTIKRALAALMAALHVYGYQEVDRAKIVSLGDYIDGHKEELDSPFPRLAVETIETHVKKINRSSAPVFPITAFLYVYKDGGVIIGPLSREWYEVGRALEAFITLMQADCRRALIEGDLERASALFELQYVVLGRAYNTKPPVIVRRMTLSHQWEAASLRRDILRKATEGTSAYHRVMIMEMHPLRKWFIESFEYRGALLIEAWRRPKVWERLYTGSQSQEVVSCGLRRLIEGMDAMAQGTLSSDVADFGEDVVGGVDFRSSQVISHLEYIRNLEEMWSEVPEDMPGGGTENGTGPNAMKLSG